MKVNKYACDDWVQIGLDFRGREKRHERSSVDGKLSETAVQTK